MIEINGLDQLIQSIDKLIIGFPEKRRDFHDKAGDIILETVKKNTPINTERYKGTHLRDAIYKVVGSKGGYTAIRADHMAAPHVHLIEDGHWRGEVYKDKNGKWKTKKGSHHVKFVKGVHMFAKGFEESKSSLQALAEEFADEIAGKF